MPPRKHPRNSHLLRHIHLQDEIEVWWPHDQTYYPGRITKTLPGDRHRVLYNDGEVEELRLETEQWRFRGAAAGRVQDLMNHRGHRAEASSSDPNARGEGPPSPSRPSSRPTSRSTSRPTSQAASRRQIRKPRGRSRTRSASPQPVAAASSTSSSRRLSRGSQPLREQSSQLERRRKSHAPSSSAIGKHSTVETRDRPDTGEPKPPVSSSSKLETGQSSGTKMASKSAKQDRGPLMMNLTTDADSEAGPAAIKLLRRSSPEKSSSVGIDAPLPPGADNAESPAKAPVKRVQRASSGSDELKSSRPEVTLRRKSLSVASSGHLSTAPHHVETEPGKSERHSGDLATVAKDGQVHDKCMEKVVCDDMVVKAAQAGDDLSKVQVDHDLSRLGTARVAAKGRPVATPTAAGSSRTSPSTTQQPPLSEKRTVSMDGRTVRLPVGDKAKSPAVRESAESIQKRADLAHQKALAAAAAVDVLKSNAEGRTNPAGIPQAVVPQPQLSKEGSPFEPVHRRVSVVPHTVVPGPMVDTTGFITPGFSPGSKVPVGQKDVPAVAVSSLSTPVSTPRDAMRLDQTGASLHPTHRFVGRPPSTSGDSTMTNAPNVGVELPEKPVARIPVAAVPANVPGRSSGAAMAISSLLSEPQPRRPLFDPTGNNSIALKETNVPGEVIPASKVLPDSIRDSNPPAAVGPIGPPGRSEVANGRQASKSLPTRRRPPQIGNTSRVSIPFSKHSALTPTFRTDGAILQNAGRVSASRSTPPSPVPAALRGRLLAFGEEGGTGNASVYPPMVGVASSDRRNPSSGQMTVSPSTSARNIAQSGPKARNIAPPAPLAKDGVKIQGKAMAGSAVNVQSKTIKKKRSYVRKERKSDVAPNSGVRMVTGRDLERVQGRGQGVVLGREVHSRSPLTEPDAARTIPERLPVPSATVHDNGRTQVGHNPETRNDMNQIDGNATKLSAAETLQALGRAVNSIPASAVDEAVGRESSMQGPVDITSAIPVRTDEPISGLDLRKRTSGSARLTSAVGEAGEAGVSICGDAKTHVAIAPTDTVPAGNAVGSSLVPEAIVSSDRRASNGDDAVASRNTPKNSRTKAKSVAPIGPKEILNNMEGKGNVVSADDMPLVPRPMKRVAMKPKGTLPSKSSLSPRVAPLTKPVNAPKGAHIQTVLTKGVPLTKPTTNNSTKALAAPRVTGCGKGVPPKNFGPVKGPGTAKGTTVMKSSAMKVSSAVKGVPVSKAAVGANPVMPARSPIIKSVGHLQTERTSKINEGNRIINPIDDGQGESRIEGTVHQRVDSSVRAPPLTVNAVARAVGPPRSIMGSENVTSAGLKAANDIAARMNKRRVSELGVAAKRRKVENSVKEPQKMVPSTGMLGTPKVTGIVNSASAADEQTPDVPDRNMNTRLKQVGSDIAVAKRPRPPVVNECRAARGATDGSGATVCRGPASRKVEKNTFGGEGGSVGVSPGTGSNVMPSTGSGRGGYLPVGNTGEDGVNGVRGRSGMVRARGPSMVTQNVERGTASLPLDILMRTITESNKVVLQSKVGPLTSRMENLFANNEDRVTRILRKIDGMPSMEAHSELFKQVRADQTSILVKLDDLGSENKGLGVTFSRLASQKHQEDFRSEIRADVQSQVNELKSKIGALEQRFEERFGNFQDRIEKKVVEQSANLELSFKTSLKEHLQQFGHSVDEKVMATMKASLDPLAKDLQRESAIALTRAIEAAIQVSTFGSGAMAMLSVSNAGGNEGGNGQCFNVPGPRQEHQAISDGSGNQRRNDNTNTNNSASNAMATSIGNGGVSTRAIEGLENFSRCVNTSVQEGDMKATNGTTSFDDGNKNTNLNGANLLKKVVASKRASGDAVEESEGSNGDQQTDKNDVETGKGDASRRREDEVGEVSRDEAIRGSSGTSKERSNGGHASNIGGIGGDASIADSDSEAADAEAGKEKARTELLRTAARKGRLIIGRTVVEYMLSGGCRSHAPQNEGEVSVDSEWVLQASERCLRMISETMKKHSNYEELNAHLIEKLGKEEVEVDWMVVGPTVGYVQLARLNYKGWDPRLRDYEWESERRVLTKTALTIIHAEKALVGSGRIVEDWLETALKIVEYGLNEGSPRRSAGCSE